MSPEDKLTHELLAGIALAGARLAVLAYECVLQGIPPNRIAQVIRVASKSEFMTEAADKIVAMVVESVKKS